jgi:probable HAF family extracellular repeat protein
MWKMITSGNALAAMAIMGFLLLTGCSESSSLSENQDSTTFMPGELGDLADIGDFDNNDGSWGYTSVDAMDQSGNIVGQSNYGAPSRAAFLWEADTEEMTYLGIHDSSYDNYYDLDEDEEGGTDFTSSEAVAVISEDDMIEVIGNSATADGEKRAFYWHDGTFEDIPPMYYEIDFEVYDDSKNGTTFEGYVVQTASEAVAMNDAYMLINLEDEEGSHAYYWDKESTKSIKVYDEKYEDYDDVDGDDDEDNDDDDDDVDEEPAYVEIDVPVYRQIGNETSEDSVAVAINAYHQVIVNVENGERAVFYDIDAGEYESLDPFSWAETVYAVAINDDGNVVGISGDDAFFWNRTSGNMTPCGDLDGDASVATGLNNSNQVVGYAANEDGDYHAFLWESGDGVTDLGTLGGSNSWAYAINDNGMVIGVSETEDTYDEGSQDVAIYHACIWFDGEVYDLGVITDFVDASDGVVYPFSKSAALNENNRVAGNSYTINSHSRGFVLDPVIP